jgi:hypothetical protein
MKTGFLFGNRELRYHINEQLRDQGLHGVAVASINIKGKKERMERDARRQLMKG